MATQLNEQLSKRLVYLAPGQTRFLVFHNPRRKNRFISLGWMVGVATASKVSWFATADIAKLSSLVLNNIHFRWVELGHTIMFPVAYQIQKNETRLFESGCIYNSQLRFYDSQNNPPISRSSAGYNEMIYFSGY